MRLPAEKVREAVLHTDQDVREAAAYYFASSFSCDPTVMPLVIQAMPGALAHGRIERTQPCQD